MFRLACTAIVGAALAAPVASQKPFAFDIDINQSSFTFGGTATIPLIGALPIQGLPSNTFEPVGALDFDLQTSGPAITSGRFVADPSVVAIPRLSAWVENPLAPGFPLVTFTVTGATVQFTSPSFTVSGGSFSTQVTATMLSGTASGVFYVTGGSFSIDLTGSQTNPAPITGTFAHGASGFSLNVPLSGAFPFTEPKTGITGSLSITGTVVADDFALSPDRYSISLPAGGSQKLTLSAGSAHAGQVYFVLGSAANTIPGLNFGGVILPLNYDGWMQTSIVLANGPVFVNTVAILDAGGIGSAAIAFPPLNIPALFGLNLDHAYLVLSGSSAVFASNAVALRLTS